MAGLGRYGGGGGGGGGGDEPSAPPPQAPAPAPAAPPSNTGKLLGLAFIVIGVIAVGAKGKKWLFLNLVDQ